MCSISFIRTYWCADFNNISNCIFDIDNIFDLIQSSNLDGHHVTFAFENLEKTYRPNAYIISKVSISFFEKRTYHKNKEDKSISFIDIFFFFFNFNAKKESANKG